MVPYRYIEDSSALSSNAPDHLGRHIQLSHHSLNKGEPKAERTSGAPVFLRQRNRALSGDAVPPILGLDLKIICSPDCDFGILPESLTANAPVEVKKYYIGQNPAHYQRAEPIVLHES
ncbi:hypothetical protein PCANC_21585 [Puccinia coronata f. sp. avenae]|uniref:Uncharacterized protein n=1 Tax=Puccinia coronata f. sp. avenae TaxID=200324 RepID=A0A2N5SDU2_9BASI|nr:hypothetical protein PCANC_21585 [Puccinia coronata f. sp. avenae]PLW11413.1 hypothetical protein PCASD_20214 [Puccinia coronata f. sp. avenae]PLW33969.1 hypothetical protein PCASD_12343 [Puccinia coronata f. sp. avenae]